MTQKIVATYHSVTEIQALYLLVDNSTDERVKTTSRLVSEANASSDCISGYQTYESAKTILVLVTFSIVNFVFPPEPATLPIALDRWLPFKGFTEKQKEGG